MALSSNTLIHFTNSKEALKGILAENFRLKYCCETIQFHGMKSVLHTPMVSFCDIPLSQIKNHIASYGHYGIGLSRAWALRNRLNPVLYIQGLSALAQTYEDLIKLLYKEEKDGVVDKSARIMVKDMARYIKNYEGPLERGGNTIANYRFSDEREWRYVPDRSEKFEMLYTNDAFQATGKSVANDSLSSLRLSFDPDDIKYIIIERDAEIREFVEHLKSVKGDKYSFHQIERLTTRILTSEQIHSDI